MDQRISLITLGVADLSRAVAFYEEVLGWDVAERHPEIAFFDLGGVIFSLFGHDDLAKDMTASEVEPGTYQGCALAQNVRSRAEVDATFAALRAGGATITKEPEEASWGGYSGYFADPDGHQWEVAYNPYWTIQGNGQISLTVAEGAEQS